MMQLTRASWLTGLRNAAICGVGSVVALGVLATVISAGFGQNLLDSVVLAFMILFAASLAAVGLGWWAGRKRAGAVLLDCGPSPSRRLFLLNGGLFLILGVASGLAFPGRYGMLVAVVGLMGSAFYFFMAFGRLQVRENGIWVFVNLMDWHKIRSYFWQDGGDLTTLMIQARTRYPVLGRSALQVSMGHKDTLDEYLRARCTLEA